MQIEIIDFHSHILPGMDDGSPDVPTSMEMLRTAARQGVGIQVLTPHYYPWREEIGRFAARRADSAEKLLSACDAALPALRVGAEVAYFPNMSESDLSALCIDGTRALLVELPFESWDSRVGEQLAALTLDRGYAVILAHIERYLHYRGNAEALEKLSALPLCVQINAEAFSRLGTRRTALELFRRGRAQLLGSDAHNLTNRSPDLGSGRRFLQKKLGTDVLRYIDETGSGLLRGESVVR